MNDYNKQSEADAKKGNELIKVRHLALELMRQDSSLLMVEAAILAREIVRNDTKGLVN